MCDRAQTLQNRKVAQKISKAFFSSLSLENIFLVARPQMAIEVAKEIVNNTR
ncbi:MAG TPA: hypothetical protein V6D28_01885 [Leptolyngbyaceae cyanobacterium]